MASGNLEFVRSLYADWERGDYSSAEWAAPDIEYVVADGPTPGRWTGLGGMADGTREFLSAWENYRAEVEEYRELDDERVLIFLTYRGRGKLSGVELEQVGGKGAHVVHIRNGKVTRLVRYLIRDHALTDLGLSA